MTKTILIVDDSPDIPFSVKMGLKELGADYNIISVDSGEKCLELLKENQIPDLILLDLMMPGISGWDTYDQIQENLNWKNIPVVFLTARTDNVAKTAGSFLGADYIEKPFEISDLKKRIDKVLEEK